MSSLWSSTRAAVNQGYGMDSFYLKKVHPELLMAPPYSQDFDLTKRRRYPRGGSVVKGSAEAKARMAFLRSLRGKRKKGGRCMRGGKSYNTAALRGGDGFWSDLFASLSGTAMNAIKKIALDANVSITELLADPQKLLEKVKEYAPKAVSAVRRFIQMFKKNSSSSSSSSTEEPVSKPKPKPKPTGSSSSRKRYLQWLRDNDPEEYYRLKKKHTQKPTPAPPPVSKYDDDDDDDDTDVDDAYLNKYTRSINEKPVSIGNSIDWNF